jgi:hypothetical protein
MNDQHPLVGAWRLVSWENRATDGQVSYPLGADALGYLVYTADRRFSVTISGANRARFTKGDLLGGTVQEKARAVEGFVAYAGRYTFHGQHVVHHVELSPFPNWVGTHGRSGEPACRRGQNSSPYRTAAHMPALVRASGRR